MKPCRRCGETKPLEEFYRHKMMADGHLNFCKPCVRERVRDRERRLRRKDAAWREREKQRSRDKAAQYGSALTRLMRKRHPEQGRARAAVSYALRTGRLTKPDQCPRCGDPGRIEGHHPDYSRPLDVRWLCSLCHGEEHQRAGAA